MKIKSLHDFEKKEEYSNPDLVEVYKDTLLKATRYAIGTTQKIFHKIKINSFKSKEGLIFVENIDTVSAIIKYSDESTCVLNMASWKTPGGGVSYGAKAQEEALFRCSNLGLSISLDCYPLIHTATLYTSDVVFFKDKYYNDLPYGYEVDVITSPAIKIVDGVKEENYEELTNDKIEVMLNFACAHEQDNLILGAWGCGVYKNDPLFIAKTFKKHLESKRYCFKRVIFAIINDHNSVGNNYEIFKSVLE